MEFADLLLIIAWIGYLLAIGLYWGLGKVFWVPIALDLSYDILGAKFGIWGNDMQTLIIMTAYEVLLLLWVIYMSGLLRTRWAIPVMFSLIIVASFTGLVTTAIFQDIGVSRFAEIVGLPGYDQKWILLTTMGMYTWSTCTFLLIFGVVLKSTVFRWVQGHASDLITNPRKRILIPIGLYTAIIGFSQIYQGFVPEAIYSWRFAIAGTSLGWGWVAMELPFYLMYRRMIQSRVE